MLSNCTVHARVVTRSMSRALLSNYQFYDAPEKKQFRLKFDSAEASIEYTRQGDFYDLLHTFVPKEHEGKGIGKIIAEKAFEHVKNSNCHMRLTCEYLAHVHQKFGDKYKDLLATEK